MPYIDQKSREELEIGRAPKNGGELNYLITKALIPIVPQLRAYFMIKSTEEGVRYWIFNDIFGALFGACLELVRRVLPEYASYETIKTKENGDVYFCDPGL